MKRLIITESERNNILRKHGIILEQEDELNATEMLKSIQKSVGTSADAKIGPDTTKKIVSTLGGLPKTSSDFTCVTNHPNKKRVAYDDEKTGFQIGDLVFDKSGNYYNVKDETKKYTYKCNGAVIETSNDGKIEGEVKKDNTEAIKNDIRKLRKFEQLEDPAIIDRLMKTYKKEEIMKAVEGDNKMIELLNQKPDTPKSSESSVTTTSTTIAPGNPDKIYDETTLLGVQ